MAKIKQVRAREILNAKGNPTVEASVILDNDIVGIAASPSGYSQGKFEVQDIHDKDENRFKGLGVLKAVANIENTIAPKLIGKDPIDQHLIDMTLIDLDGTDNKANLGANTLISVSMAVAKAGANAQKKPLYLHLQSFTGKINKITKIPIPLFNVMNGGSHGSGALDFQEFIISPASSKSYSESLLIGFTVYQSLKKMLNLNNFSSSVGDEGGFEPKIDNNHSALTFLKQAIDETSIRLGYDVFLGLDAGANSFYSNKEYRIKDKHSRLSARDIILYYQELAKEFHLIYLEDILAEEDWDGWTEASRVLSDLATITGDSLTSTNLNRLSLAVEKKAISGVLVKPNQIGTVLEAIAFAEAAKTEDLKIIVAQRLAETNDDFIADFGVAVQADYVKFGGPARGEHVAKYNRLLEIERELQK